jgi:2-methylisocitrate lyase-like PEP mutase family enzyme
MISTSQKAKAVVLRDSHKDGVLVLPNAWDAGSAAMIASAGATVIATTSAGVSWALGRPDGQHLSRDEMVEVIARIVAAVDLPVTADVEGGYGLEPSAVAQTVRDVITAGAVGINLEDSQPSGALFTPGDQAARVAAARAAAVEAGLPEFFVNVRTDVYLFGIGEPAGRLDDVLARAKAYTDAGADGFFVPGMLDLDTLAALTSKVTLPVNVMVGAGAPDVAALTRAGVRRISLGMAIAQASYTLARNAAAEALNTGTWDCVVGAAGFGEINAAFPAE